MMHTIKIKFTNSNGRPDPKDLGIVPLWVREWGNGVYTLDRYFKNNEELDAYLKLLNLEPCVSLAWLWCQ
jgi:hypothetical protein